MRRIMNQLIVSVDEDLDVRAFPRFHFALLRARSERVFFSFFLQNLKNESIFSLCHVAYYYLTTDLLTYSRKNVTFSPLRRKMKRREEDNSG